MRLLCAIIIVVALAHMTMFVLSILGDMVNGGHLTIPQDNIDPEYWT